MLRLRRTSYAFKKESSWKDKNVEKATLELEG